MKSIEFFEKKNNEKLKKELDDLENQRKLLRQGVGIGVLNDIPYSPVKLDDSPYKYVHNSAMGMNVKLKGGMLKMKSRSPMQLNSNFS